jgi:uncharacterized protein involved in outer membrane biogenesis
MIFSRKLSKLGERILTGRFGRCNMKKALIVIAVIVVLIIVGIVLLFSNLNSLVAKAIEKNGSDVTQTSVSVSGVDISIREGRGTIEGLTVASPDGFSARNAFALEGITVDIDIESLRGEPIVIDEIRIQAPVVNAEISENGSSNIDELRKNVQAYSKGEEEKEDEPGGQARKIRIKQFIFEKGSVQVDATALGLEARTISLPEIRLQDVGGADGAPPDQITKIILSAVAKNVASEIADSEIQGLIKDKLGGSLKDKAKGLLDKITK